MKNKLDILKATYIQNIWINELELLSKKWEEHKKYIEEDYISDNNNIKITSQSKKKTKK